MSYDPGEKVRQFHNFFDGIVREEPTVITGRELELRKTLLREELDELIEALDGGNLREIAKEAADLEYVLHGLDAHIGGVLEQAFNIVHDSNMTKLWDCPRCDGEGSLCAHREYSPPICPQCLGAARVPIYREDGKVLKPPTYHKADLSFIPENPPTKDEL